MISDAAASASEWSSAVLQPARGAPSAHQRGLKLRATPLAGARSYEIADWLYCDLHPRHDDRRVGAAEAEAVGEGGAHRFPDCGVRRHVEAQIAAGGIDVLQVDGGRNYSVVDRQHGGEDTHRAGG